MIILNMVWKTVGLFAERVKHVPPLWPSHSTFKYLPKRKEICPHKDFVHTNAHSSFFCKYAKLETTCKYPSSGKWRNRLWPIHIIEYYSTTGRDEILMHETMWMNFQIIVMKRQAKKCTYHMIPLIKKS